MKSDKKVTLSANYKYSENTTFDANFTPCIKNITQL